MSTGILHSLHRIEDVEIRESSRVQNEPPGEQPTVADLVLPGTGYNFSEEFACLLNVLGGKKGE